MTKNIRQRELRFPPKYWNGISDDAKAFIIELLKVDPNERLGSADDYFDVLLHPWISDLDYID